MTLLLFSAFVSQGLIEMHLFQRILAGCLPCFSAPLTPQQLLLKTVQSVPRMGPPYKGPNARMQDKTLLERLRDPRSLGPGSHCLVPISRENDNGPEASGKMRRGFRKRSHGVGIQVTI